MSEEAVTEARFSLKTVALRAFHLPVSWYHSLTQQLVKFWETVWSAVSKIGSTTLQVNLNDNCLIEVKKCSSCSSSRQNLTLSLSSAKEKGSQSCIYANGGLFSKYSGSVQSLVSVSKSVLSLVSLMLCLESGFTSV
uniref:Uncharacterized protein n=1 Tax=Pavo cristatus TaxID=9049 RepID=A0A8C9G3X2_PAVCR